MVQRRSKQKNKIKPWGKDPILDLGWTETPFNKAVSLQINYWLDCFVELMTASAMKRGTPDIMGIFGGVHLSLENKFLNEIPVLDSTVCLGPKAKKGFSPSQVEYFEAALDASGGIVRGNTEPLLGGLVGVHAEEQFIISVSAEFIVDQAELTAEMVRHASSIVSMTGSPFISYDCGEFIAHSELRELIGNI